MDAERLGHLVAREQAAGMKPIEAALEAGAYPAWA
jgi:hypothetical protein